MMGHSIYGRPFRGVRLMRRFTIPSLLAAIALAHWVLTAAAQESPFFDEPPENGPLPAFTPSEPIPLPPVETAATYTTLTLAEAEALALSCHPAMRQAQGQVRAARGNWVQVGLRPNPEIGYMGEEIGNEGEAGQQGGFVSKEFVTAGKLRLN